jgi:carbon monoxide dehydrogenase subunit G
MQFNSNFIVAGTPQEVCEHMANVPLMASFLPGASVAAPNADGSYPATLVASFGPKRIAFKGTLTNQVDHESFSGVLAGQASADVRGARMAVTMSYRLVPAGAAHGVAAESARTQVFLESQAQLSGVLAEFAKTGGVIVAEALIAEFAKRFSAHLQAAAAGESIAISQQEATLSASTVLGAVLKRFWRWLFHRLTASTGRGRPGASRSSSEA